MSPIQRPCAGGCGVLVPRGRCAACSRQHQSTRRPPWLSELYGSIRWQKVRKLKLTITPMCERCVPITSLSVATEVHHKVPVLERPDLGLDLDNLESLCGPCHDAIDKTRARWW
jgi:5-methylcytosine-specific restriction enzyme A